MEYVLVNKSDDVLYVKLNIVYKSDDFLYVKLNIVYCLLINY